MNIRCPHCRNAIELVRDEPEFEVVCPSCHSKVSFDELLSIDASQTVTQDFENEKPLERGDQLAHFRIEEPIGRGGFGTVYRAFDSLLQRSVAIKIPRMQNLSQWQADSFLHEAQAAAQLRDPNIVAVHEVGRHADQIYIVSDYIEGVTLGNWLTENRPSQKECAELVATLARSLQKAHQEGVVHRDIKPSNVIVDEAGVPHITDFGLAKRENPEEISITTSGQIVGTPAYMSPEQASGNSDHADGRTDIYSLGVTLYEMLAGRRPFLGESDILVEEIKAGRPSPIHAFNKKVSPDLEAICLKAMELKPGNRFRSAAEFADELDRFRDGQPTLTRPPGVAKQAIRWFAHHWMQCSIAALLLFVSSLGILLSQQWGKPPSENSVAETLEKRVLIPVSPVSVKTVVRVARIDFDKLGLVDFANVVTSDTPTEGDFEFSLLPGWYLVEAEIPGVGIQEVWRRVPEGMDEQKNRSQRSMNWERISETEFRLHPITVSPQELGASTLSVGNQNLVAVDGAEFSLLDDPSDPGSIPKDFASDDFFYGKKEVSAQQFKETMGRYPWTMKERLGDLMSGDQPVTNVTFFEALEFCERNGCRLPTVSEYMTAATNAGTTRFPAGNNYSVDPSWPLLPVSSDTNDVTSKEPKIEGLYSSAFEWTQEVEMPRMPTTGKVIKWEILPIFDASVLIVGGPTGNVIDGGELGETRIVGPTRVILGPIKAGAKNRLGFRMAKSKKSRLAFEKSRR